MLTHPALYFLAFLVVVVWVLPVWLGRQIGKPKHRAGGWWGFWLGWLGVLVVALLPAKEQPTFTPETMQPPYRG